MAEAPGPRAAALALLALASLTVLAGCGGGDGVEKGATVNAYVAAALCPEAKRQLAGGSGRVGDVRLAVVCLPQPASRARVDLAAQGANARRATEDSTAVAFLEANGPGAKFAAPIVESAGLAFVESASGANAIERVESAIDAAGDSASIRDRVAKALQ